MFVNRKTMKKRISLLIAAFIILVMTGCGGYISSYKATGFVRSNTSTSVFMNFWSFEGRMVFRLRAKAEGELKYTASLEKGNLTVFYDNDGTKSELFSLKDGGTADSSGGYVEEGTVYIIVETDGKCENGELRIGLE